MIRPILFCAGLMLPTLGHAQGFLDRIVGEVAPATITHDTSPSVLAERGIFVYDPRTDLTNMPIESLSPSPHTLILTHLSGGEPKAYLPATSGAACAQLALSITRTHGGGWAYCHPETVAQSAPAGPDITR